MLVGFSERERNFSVFQIFETDSGVHPASYLMDTRVETAGSRN
jgi:hypothetical protein